MCAISLLKLPRPIEGEEDASGGERAPKPERKAIVRGMTPHNWDSFPSRVFISLKSARLGIILEVILAVFWAWIRLDIGMHDALAEELDR